MFIKPKYVEKFLLGAIGALGSITMHEGYRVYKTCDPIVKAIKEKKSKERFDHIMSQTNLKKDFV